jgi:acetyl esterase/lipase
MAKNKVVVGHKVAWVCAKLAGAMQVILLVAIAGCRVTSLPLWEGSTSAGPFEVERIRDVAYCPGPENDSFRHQLDLFLPNGQKDFPVVVLIHGGAWIMGDNRCCGLYSSVGEFLAGQGIGAVLPNYRLAPGVKHPEQIKDVAKAFAWTRRHIAEYGGCPDRLFLAGHSAGGHLVALLATDERYLKAEGLETADIKGVIAVSGVYRIPPGKMEATWGGVDPAAFRFDEISPLREPGSKSLLGAAMQGIPLKLNVFGPAFGNDPKVREDASPLNHVRPGLPPFLIFCAERDLPTLPAMAEEFHQALLDNRCEARFLRIPNRNHNSVMFHAIAPEDPVAKAMLEFIRASATIQ